MKHANWTRLTADLSRHGRVAAVEADGEDLVLCLKGGTVRLTADRDHDRTVLWAPVLGVANNATAAAAEAALEFNSEFCADTTVTMGFFIRKSMLLLGKSICDRQPDAAAIVDEALGLLGLLAEARHFVKAALERQDEGAATPPATSHMPAVRV